MAQRYRIVITDLLDDDLAPEREALGELADVEALQAGQEADVQDRVDGRRWHYRVSLDPSHEADDQSTHALSA